jgi:E3 ubiquitin-protein ligase HUWE1
MMSDFEPGRKIAVTDANKFEYITIMTRYKLMDRVKMQMDAFKSGFYEIVPLEALQIFNENELELLICGLPDIDINDWKNHTEYIDNTQLLQATNSMMMNAASHFIQSIAGNSKDRTMSTLIAWFWRAVESFSQEQRANLLQFVTGTTMVPLGGFANLRSSSQIKKFNILIDRNKSDQHLPNSRTCFNQLILPSYSDYDILRSKILIAITESSTGFGTS